MLRVILVETKESNKRVVRFAEESGGVMSTVALSWCCEKRNLIPGTGTAVGGFDSIHSNQNLQATTIQLSYTRGKFGLYVATDVEGLLSESKLMRNKSAELMSRLEEEKNITLHILTGAMIAVDETRCNVSDTTKKKEFIEFIAAFRDIQMAVYAEMGFVGTKGSTFSEQVVELRQSEFSCPTGKKVS